MPDDGNRGRAAVGKILNISSLDSLPGVVDCQQICGRCVRHRLQTGTHTGMIDHIEHDFHTLTFFSQQIANAVPFAAQCHAAGCTGMNSMLFLHTRADDVVALAQSSVIIDQIFRHQKQ